VEIDGDFYCDGALVDLAPMDAICCKHRLDAVIIHHVSQRYDRPGHLEKVLQRRWALAEISTWLLFHQRPWYLSEERLTVWRCPDGCGAVIVVVEPDLPDLQWPLTEGGPKVLKAALAQTLELLQPHADALLTDPRARLPAQAVDPAGNSGHRAAVCAPGNS
jgi:hypothetical protein